MPRVGRHVEFVRGDHRARRAGVLRGLHWPEAPHAQGKPMRVSRGAVFDVAATSVAARRPSAAGSAPSSATPTGASSGSRPALARGFLVLSESADCLCKARPTTRPTPSARSAGRPRPKIAGATSAQRPRSRPRMPRPAPSPSLAEARRRAEPPAARATLAGARGATTARRPCGGEHPQLAKRHRALLRRFADQAGELDARQPGRAELLEVEQLGVQRDDVGAARADRVPSSTAAAPRSMSGVVRWPSACTSPASQAACRRRKRDRAASSTSAPSRPRRMRSRRSAARSRRGAPAAAPRAAPARAAAASARTRCRRARRRPRSAAARRLAGAARREQRPERGEDAEPRRQAADDERRRRRRPPRASCRAGAARRGRARARALARRRIAGAPLLST